MINSGIPWELYIGYIGYIWATYNDI
jgi:hypothetical protein